MAEIRLLRRADGALAIRMRDNGAEYIGALEAEDARDLMHGLAVALADRGEGDALYRPGLEPQAKVDNPPRFSPVGLPDVMVEELTGAIGMVFAHKWLGPVAVLLSEDDALTLGASLVERG